MSAPDLPPQLEDPTNFPDGSTAEVSRRVVRPEVPPGPPFDLRRTVLLGLVLLALVAGSLLFLQ